VTNGRILSKGADGAGIIGQDELIQHERAGHADDKSEHAGRENKSMFCFRLRRNDLSHAMPLTPKWVFGNRLRIAILTFKTIGRN
jgi:hypothetical protein